MHPGGQDVSTHKHKGVCHRGPLSSLLAQGPCGMCEALEARMCLWERTSVAKG